MAWMSTRPGVTHLWSVAPRHRAAFVRPRPLQSRPPRGGYPCPAAAQPALSPTQCEVFMNRSRSFTAVFLGIASVSSDLCSVQDRGITPGATRNNDPVVFTTVQDRQNMLDQLGI